jgi:hypothetical protein
MRMTLALLSLLLAVRTARAHDAPILPSLCTFDPIALDAPASGLGATAVTAGPGDAYRIVYDAGAGMAQFCPADPTDPAGRCAAGPSARAFSGGVTGTIALPFFAAHLLASGDLFADRVPVAFGFGGASESVPMALTTGLVAVAGAVFEGAPIGADGSLALVGVGTVSLAGALDGATVVVRLSCKADPVPDLDQFMASTRTTAIRGVLGARGARLHVAFRAGAPVALGVTEPDFTQPVEVRVSANGATIAALSLPLGLTSRGGRKFVGQAAGQGSIVITRGGKRSYRMLLQTSGVSLPTARGKLPVDVTYQVGGLISRGTRTFHAGAKALSAS